MSIVADNQDRLTQAIAEYMRRVDAGEAVQRDRFLDANSDVAADLGRYLDNVALVEQMAGPTLIEKSQSSTSEEGHRETVSASHGGDSVPEKKPNGSDGPLTGTFGRYQIERTLGEGAMGTVYLARDTELDRQVALKVPKFDDDDVEMTERFYREARSAARLHHRHICPVHDIGEIDGIKYISIAYIKGHPLSAYVSPDKPQSERNIAAIVRKLALALDMAHREGVIHRDLKPANVMVDGKSEPIIMDFGLAREINRQEDNRLTKTGTIMGSPAYMSPEQVNADHEKIGPSSDIYSLGVMLYELLTGRLPFDGNAVAIIGQILMAEPEKPSTFRADLDPRLEAICAKMMAKEIDERYASMKDVADALTSFLKNPGQPGGKRSVGNLDSFAPVDLKEVRKQSAKVRRTRQGSGEREGSGSTEQHSAMDRFKKLPGRTKAIAGGLAGLLILAGITIIIKIGDQTVQVDSDASLTRIGISNGAVEIEADEPVPAPRTSQLPAPGVQLPESLDDLATGKWVPILTSEADFKADENTTATWNDGVLDISKAAGETMAQVDLVTAPDVSNVILRADVNLLTGHNAGLQLESADSSADFNHVNAHITRKGCVLWRSNTLTKKSGGVPIVLPADEVKPGFRDFAIAFVGGRVAAYQDGKRIVERADWSNARNFAAGLHVFNFNANGAARAQFRNVRLMRLADDSSDLPTGQWVRLLENEGQLKRWRATNCEMQFSEGILTLTDMKQETKTEAGDGRLELDLKTDAKRFIVHVSHAKQSGFMAGEDIVVGTQCYSSGHFHNDNHALWIANNDNRNGAQKVNDYESIDGYTTFADFDYVVIDGEYTSYLNGKKMHSHQRTAASLSSIVLDVRTAKASWKDLAVMRLTDEQVAAIHAGKIPAFPDSASDDGTTGPADADKAGLVKKLTAHKSVVVCVAFSPDGRMVASASPHEHAVPLFDVSKGQKVGLLEIAGEASTASRVTFAPDGKTLAVGYTDGSIRLWDLATSKVLRELSGHEAKIYALEFTADGRRLVSAGRQTTVRVWDMATGRQITLFDKHPHKNQNYRPIQSAVFVADGTQVISTAPFGVGALRWEAETGTILQDFNDSSPGNVYLASDGSAVFMKLTGPDKHVRLTSAVDGKIIARLQGHTEAVTGFEYLPDGKHVVTGSRDGTLRLWNIVSEREVHRFTTDTHTTNVLDVSPDGRYVVSAGGAIPTPGSGGAEITKTGDFSLYVWRLPELTVAPDPTIPAESQPTPGDSLNQTISIDFRRKPFDEAMQEIGKLADVEIRIDKEALQAARYSTTLKETLQLTDKSLRDVLDEIVKRHSRMAYIVEEGHVLLTSKEAAEYRQLATSGDWSPVLTDPADIQTGLHARLLPDGIVQLNGIAQQARVSVKNDVGTKLLAGDFALRAKLKVIGNGVFTFFYRSSATNGYNVTTDGKSGIRGYKTVNNRIIDLTAAKTIQLDNREWIEWMLIARGDTTTVYADGQEILSFDDSSHKTGDITIGVDRCTLQLKEVAFQSLSKSGKTKMQWLRPAVNSAEIKALVLAELAKGTFGKPADVAEINRFALEEIRRRKADGRIGPKGDYAFEFNAKGEPISERAFDQSVPTSDNNRSRRRGGFGGGGGGGGGFGGGSNGKK